MQHLCSEMLICSKCAQVDVKNPSVSLIENSKRYLPPVSPSNLNDISHPYLSSVSLQLSHRYLSSVSLTGIYHRYLSSVSLTMSHISTMFDVYVVKSIIFEL